MDVEDSYSLFGQEKKGKFVLRHCIDDDESTPAYHDEGELSRLAYSSIDYDLMIGIGESE